MLNMIKKIGFLYFVILFNCHAKESQKELTLSMPSFAPFSFFNGFGNCEGTTVKLLKNLTANVPVKVKFVSLPYARLLHSLVNGEVDAALIFKNHSIKNDVDYVGPVSKSKVVVLSSADKPIKKYADLYQLKMIAVIRNASFSPQFDNDIALNKFSVNSYAQAVKMLQSNRVDAVVGSLVGLEYALIQQNISSSYLKQAYLLGEKEWWLHVSKKSKYRNLQPELEKAIKASFKDDLVYQIYKQQLDSCSVTPSA